MGAHHAPSATPTGLRVAATAAAALALTATGAGVALADTAHDAAGPATEHGADRVAGRSAAHRLDGADLTPSGRTALCDSDDGDASVAGLDLPGLDSLCGESSASSSGSSFGDDGLFGGFSGDRESTDADSSDRDSTGRGSADRSDSSDRSQPQSVRPAASTTQSSSAAQAPASRPAPARPAPPKNALDTPPAPGQTRIIKLPTAAGRH